MDYVDGLPQQALGNEILQDHLGRIWIAYDIGLYRYDGKEIVKYTHIPGDTTSVAQDYVLAMYEDPRNEIWVTTKLGGISVYHPETDRFTQIKTVDNGGPLPITSIYGIYADDDGNIWLAGNPGLVRYKSSTGTYEHFVFDAPGYTDYDLGFYNMMRLVVPDPARPGRLFVATRGGLLAFDRVKEEFTHHRMPYTSSEVNLDSPEYLILDMQFIDQENLWMLTWSGGLIHYDVPTGTWDRYRDAGVEDREEVGLQLQVRNKHSLWIATWQGFGIFDINSKHYYYYQNNPADPHSIANYYTVENFCFTPDSTLIVQGSSGISISDPYPGYDQSKEEYAPFLSEIRVNGERLDMDTASAYLHTLNLNEDENEVAFKITWPVFQNANSVRYQFMLEGFDKHWVDNGFANVIRYTNLGGGNYTLHYRAGRDGDHWTQGLTGLNMSVILPFWKRPVFIAGCIAVFIGLIYLAYRLRVMQIRREEKLKTEFNKRLANQEMAALRAQMNPHFMFNSLNSIKTYILQQQTQEASDYLTKFSQLMRAVLRNSKQTFISLEEEVRALRLYIELEALRFEAEFEYEIYISDQIPVAEIAIPPLLIQPYVENAIRHGLREKENGLRKLTISIQPVNGYITIVIEDNGVGREEAAQKVQLDDGRKSYGMTITRDRIDLVRQTLGIAAEVHVSDLYHTDGTAAGTRVEIRIPKIALKETELQLKV